ncbi:hypothetical protein BKA70DRAFT_1540483 [Coprinopsis sp. MPI-PUGE-AT-0042]|nr:hypothetical protein BKA70DRAFT_1540483 [Coprinopsis sp. MPI-PUGE-AT-0042]
MSASFPSLSISNSFLDVAKMVHEVVSHGTAIYNWRDTVRRKRAYSSIRRKTSQFVPIIKDIGPSELGSQDIGVLGSEERFEFGSSHLREESISEAPPKSKDAEREMREDEPETMSLVTLNSEALNVASKAAGVAPKLDIAGGEEEAIDEGSAMLGGADSEEMGTWMGEGDVRSETGVANSLFSAPSPSVSPGVGELPLGQCAFNIERSRERRHLREIVLGVILEEEPGPTQESRRTAVCRKP